MSELVAPASRYGRPYFPFIKDRRGSANSRDAHWAFRRHSCAAPASHHQPWRWAPSVAYNITSILAILILASFTKDIPRYRYNQGLCKRIINKRGLKIYKEPLNLNILLLVKNFLKALNKLTLPLALSFKQILFSKH